MNSVFFVFPKKIDKSNEANTLINRLFENENATIATEETTNRE